MPNPAGERDFADGLPDYFAKTVSEDVHTGRSSSEMPKIPRYYKNQMNKRQEKAFPVIIHKGWITRSKYQEIIGGDLSPRTAIYDLKDLVKKGLLKKIGQGPATRYVPVVETFED
jgi:predicted HTH transcriptional regulator